MLMPITKPIDSPTFNKKANNNIIWCVTKRSKKFCIKDLDDSNIFSNESFVKMPLYLYEEGNLSWSISFPMLCIEYAQVMISWIEFRFLLLTNPIYPHFATDPFLGLIFCNVYSITFQWGMLQWQMMLKPQQYLFLLEFSLLQTQIDVYAICKFHQMSQFLHQLCYSILLHYCL